MASLDDEDKNTLLKVARSAIESALNNDSNLEKSEGVSPALQEKHGCFVTLHKNGALRGCIGSIEPSRALILCVEENALNAAFRDPRFPSLKKNELDDVDIEVSVLTVPRALEYKTPEDLMERLEQGVHGVIITKDFRSATFLPQVWEQLPDKQTFLEHLCQKAGMDKTCWKDKDIVVKVYEVVCFSEKDNFL